MESRDPCSRIWPLTLALTVEAAGEIDRAFIRVVLVCRRNSPPSPSSSSFDWKPLWPGHASISVPSTETCSPTTVTCSPLSEIANRGMLTFQSIRRL